MALSLINIERDIAQGNKDLNSETKKPTLRWAFLDLVPVGGLEPPHPKAGDFESPMSTNSITLANLALAGGPARRRGSIPT